MYVSLFEIGVLAVAATWAAIFLHWAEMLAERVVCPGSVDMGDSNPEPAAPWSWAGLAPAPLDSYLHCPLAFPSQTNHPAPL